jgi:hypothetical protein
MFLNIGIAVSGFSIQTSFNDLFGWEYGAFCSACLWLRVAYADRIYLKVAQKWGNYESLYLETQLFCQMHLPPSFGIICIVCGIFWLW